MMSVNSRPTLSEERDRSCVEPRGKQLALAKIGALVAAETVFRSKVSVGGIG